MSTVGHPVRLHICDGPKLECLVSCKKTRCFHFDAWREVPRALLQSFFVNHDGCQDIRTNTDAVVRWRVGESKSQRVQHLDLSWVQDKGAIPWLRLESLYSRGTAELMPQATAEGDMANSERSLLKPKPTASSSSSSQDHRATNNYKEGYVPIVR